MSLAEFAPKPTRIGPECTARTMYDALDPDDQTELQRWIAERHTWAAIADSLRAAGVVTKILPQTLSRHFGTPRRCACDDAR